MNPLVTCVMPTRGRQQYARQAVECFLAQTYANRELLILDDADDPSFPEWPARPEEPIIGYYRESEKLSIAVKRNRINERARGRVLMHWDSDDWSAPGRIADQVQRLTASQKNVTGYHSLLFHHESGRAFKYVNTTHYALGTSLAYTAEWWRNHRFNERLEQGEDNEFVKAAFTANELISVDGDGLMVARAHSGNTSPKKLIGLNFKTADSLPAGFVALQG